MIALLTTAQVARELEVSVSRISQLVAVGKLRPAHQLPGRTGAFLFDPQHIAAVLRERDE